MTDDDLDALLRQDDELQLRPFGNDDGWRLGSALADAARDRSAAVTIDITRTGQRLFHAALSGTAIDNDECVKRTRRVVERFGHSSLYMGAQCQAQGTTPDEKYGVDPSLFAAHGGAFPITLRGTGKVGVVVVSGLPQRDDHELIVTTLRPFCSLA